MSNAPYWLGSASAASGGSTTLTLTVGASSGSNDSIFVGVLCSATASGPPTVGPDSQGNTYTLLGSDTTETAAELFIFEADGTNPLADGVDTIPITYLTNASVQGAIAAGDNNVTGSDKHVITHGSSTAPSSGSSGTLTQAEEHAIGFIVNAGAGSIPTWASPWSSDVFANIEGGTTTRMSVAGQTVTATTALTASGTITSAAWAAAIVTTLVAPVTLSVDLSDGVENEPYSQTLTGLAAGGNGTYTWSISSGALPTGVSLSGGVISGTPTASGIFNFTVEATDGHGMVGTSAQQIYILPSGLGSIASYPLENNLLSRDDSDFSSGNIGTWAAYANASALTYTTEATMVGDGCLRWTATAAGETAVSTGFYPVTAGLPYIVSGLMLPVQDAGGVQIGIAWYESNGTLIELDLGAAAVLSSWFGDYPDSGMAWQPFSATLTAPTGATKCKVVALAQDANAGDVNHIDLLYLAQSEVQVLVDWNNGTSGSGSTAGEAFMDVSPWVRMDQGIQLTSGRQDNISEIQAGSGSFQLQNDNGFFTKYKSTSLVYGLGGQITLQRRVQINLADELGEWWTRADGPISEIDYTLDNTGNTNIAAIQVTDVLAPLNREDPLSCWTQETVLANGPLYHWALNDVDQAGAGGLAAETSGNNGPPLRLWQRTSAGEGSIAWNDQTGGVETLADAVAATSALNGGEYWSAGSNVPNNVIMGLDSGTIGPVETPFSSIYLTPYLAAQSAQNNFVGNIGYSLRTNLSDAIGLVAPQETGANYTIEAWFTVDPAVATDVASKYGPYVQFALFNSETGGTLIAAIFLNGAGGYYYELAYYANPPSFQGGNFVIAPPAQVSHIRDSGTALGLDAVQIPHHVLVEITGDPSAPTATCWLDNNQFAGSSVVTLPTDTVFDTICVGADPGGGGNHYGNLSLVSIYDYLLTNTQIQTDCMMGQYGMWQQATDNCISQLVTFASIPAFWDNTTAASDGCSLTEYYDITSSNALSAMEVYEQTEQGLLFVNRQGQLTFHTRDWRMGYGDPDLYLPPDTFDASMGYEIIDQYMCNEQGIASAVFTTGTGYINQESQDNYGAYASATVTEPVQLPLISWSRIYGACGILQYAYWPTPNMTDYAAWAANSKAEPYLTPGQLTIDLKTLSKESTGIGISDLYALEIDNMVAPSGELPASWPDMNLSYEWFIEGIDETITNSARSIQFYTSPAEASRAWVPGDDTYGVLGTTTRLGVSSTDLNQVPADGKAASIDGGLPYWPPTFSTTMNNPAANGHAFVGANDLRGMTDSINKMLNPPMWCVGQQSNDQSIPSGSNGGPQIYWDTIYMDTLGGMGMIPGWPNWYCITVPGYYDLDGSIIFAEPAPLGTGQAQQGYFLVARQAAQGVAAGTRTPLTNAAYVCPIGSQERAQTAATYGCNTFTTRMYLGVGDMIACAAEQGTGSAWETANVIGGSMFSGCFRGYATSDDTVQINSSVTGGTVKAGGGSGGTGGTSGGTGKGGTTYVQHTATFHNTHTYAYYGAGVNYERRNVDGDCYQGDPQSGIGVEMSQIAWNYSSIASTLSGATILSATLEGHCLHTWYGSGGVLLLGWSTVAPGGSTFKNTPASYVRMTEIDFTAGQTRTFPIPIAMVGGIQNASGKCFVIGDGTSQSLSDYGYWSGGPSSWTLTVNYEVPA